jgi:pSer/pThr/pTyr-binding forkhead associated (FHA) protein
MPTFTISVNSKVLGTYVVKKAVITVGRSRSNTISIASKAVSRTHVRIEHAGEGWTVTDLGSLNGTYVNDIRITNAFLSEGDKVTIGAYAILFSPEPSLETSEEEVRPVAAQPESEGTDTDVRVDGSPPSTETALAPPQDPPAPVSELRLASKQSRGAERSGQAVVENTVEGDEPEAGAERPAHPETKAFSLSEGGDVDEKGKANGADSAGPAKEGRLSLLRSNPAGLQLKDRVRLAVFENPLADEADIRKRLSDPDFGGANVGKSELQAMLKTLGLETKIKRYNYFLHS